MKPEASTPTLPHYSVPTPEPIVNQLPHLQNQTNPDTYYNGCADTYFSDSDNNPMSEDMVGDKDKPINPINTCTVSPLVVALKIIPSKVLKKRCKTIRRLVPETIKRAQTDNSTSEQFLLAIIHSVSQSIIRAHTDKIAIYNMFDLACCADYGTSEDMFPD